MDNLHWALDQLNLTWQLGEVRLNLNIKTFFTSIRVHTMVYLSINNLLSLLFVCCFMWMDMGLVVGPFDWVVAVHVSVFGSVFV